MSSSKNEGAFCAIGRNHVTDGTTKSCCSSPSKMNENDTYDLAVIGAGSAGFSAAITASEGGAKVVLIGSGTIGGTCVNVGCVPSKAMIRAAEIFYQTKAASRFAGIKAKARVEDWAVLVAQKDELVTTLRHAKYTDLLPAYENITYMKGAAQLTADGVLVGENRLKTKKIILATGTSTPPPNIVGIDDVPYLTSTEALDLKVLPKSLLVVGGGYVGCELAQMFERFGVAVTIVCRSRILPKTEPEISTALTDYLRDEGITILDGLTYQSIKNGENGIVLSARKDDKTVTVEAEQVLMTTGRRPNTDGLNLPENGIDLLPNGGVKVDQHMCTTRPDVYAAGDITGTDQFVYMAAYGAKIAANNAINGDRMVYDNAAMPWVIFTDPQVAGVGLSEATAKAKGIKVKTSTIGLEHVPRALAARDTRGLIKLVADQKTNKLIGAQIIAPEGADTIQTAVLAIKCNLTVTDLANTIFPYLTTVEGLKLAAQTFDKDVRKLSCCAG